MCREPLVGEYLQRNLECNEETRIPYPLYVYFYFLLNPNYIFQIRGVACKTPSVHRIASTAPRECYCNRARMT